eukprot:SAG31_NODE_6964_length_1832_cov_1.891518_1_plen_276_part_10
MCWPTFRGCTHTAVRREVYCILLYCILLLHIVILHIVILHIVILHIVILRIVTEVLDLSGESWLLAVDRGVGPDHGANVSWLQIPLSVHADALGRTVRMVALPASFDNDGLNSTENLLLGAFYVEREVFVPTGWCTDGKAVQLRIGAASEQISIYVDGALLCRHVGGYVPFECKVPVDQICAAPPFRIRLTAVVTNDRSWATLPPGKVVEAAGVRRLDQWSGQYSYSGIHGSVHLVATPVQSVSDVRSNTTLLANHSEAILHVSVDIAGCSGTPTI